MDIKEFINVLLSDITNDNENIIFEFVPELKMCVGFNQNNSWHDKNVYDHIIAVVNGVDHEITVRLAALFHDVGKPLCYTEEIKDGIVKGHFYGHPEKSREIFLEFAKRNNLDKELTKKVALLIYYHDNWIDEQREVTKLKTLSNFSYEDILKLYDLRKADNNAQNQTKILEKGIYKRLEDEKDFILNNYYKEEHENIRKNIKR